jgi:hypothetical protein
MEGVMAATTTWEESWNVKDWVDFTQVHVYIFSCAWGLGVCTCVRAFVYGDDKLGRELECQRLGGFHTGTVMMVIVMVMTMMVIMVMVIIVGMLKIV